MGERFEWTIVPDSGSGGEADGATARTTTPRSSGPDAFLGTELGDGIYTFEVVSLKGGPVHGGADSFLGVAPADANDHEEGKVLGLALDGRPNGVWKMHSIRSGARLLQPDEPTKGNLSDRAAMGKGPNDFGRALLEKAPGDTGPNPKNPISKKGSIIRMQVRGQQLSFQLKPAGEFSSAWMISPYYAPSPFRPWVVLRNKGDSVRFVSFEPAESSGRNGQGQGGKAAGKKRCRAGAEEEEAAMESERGGANSSTSDGFVLSYAGGASRQRATPPGARAPPRMPPALPTPSTRTVRLWIGAAPACSVVPPAACTAPLCIDHLALSFPPCLPHAYPALLPQSCSRPPTSRRSPTRTRRRRRS